MTGSLGTRALVLLFFMGCAGAGASGPNVSRRDMEECRGADPVSWAESSRAALVVRTVRLGPLYDIDAKGIAVPYAAVSRHRGEAGLAVLAYPEPGRFPGGPPEFWRLGTRSFVYDDALYALERTMARDHRSARAALVVLAQLQRSDGAFGFSFQAEGGFYNAGYVRAGAVAFVVYAFAKHVLATGDRDLIRPAILGGAWLLEQRDPESGLIRAGRGKWDEDGKHFDPAYVAGYAVTEHQIDAFFALLALAQLDSRGPWGAAARDLREAILSRLWIRSEARLAAGWSQALGLDGTSALDSSGTWGALFLHAAGEDEAALAVLRWVEARHRVTSAGWAGFRPYVPSRPLTWFVEGSVAYALAGHRLAPAAPDLASSSRALLAELAHLACESGVPLVYSTEWARDFPLTPAAAPSLWFALVAREVVGGTPALWTESLPNERRPNWALAGTR